MLRISALLLQTFFICANVSSITGSYNEPKENIYKSKGHFKDITTLNTWKLNSDKHSLKKDREIQVARKKENVYKNNNILSSNKINGRRQFIPRLFGRYQFISGDDYGQEVRYEGAGPCLGRPCQHEGRCMLKRRGYFCSCAPGFIGKHCEFRKECDSETCKNGGTCTEESMGRHLCTCKVGFRGENCQDISRCHPNPCRNGGECSETEDSYICLCKEGHKGVNCEQLNQCDPNPCKNSGTCFEQDNDFYCNCPSMYRGKTCEVISECSQVRCANGGTCQDLINGYKCKCPYGFFGDTCEVNPCQPNPCMNDGYCSNFGTEYICQCSNGYSGRNCEVHSPCSRQNLCLNGGTCVDSTLTNSDYGFACVCPKNAEGILCERRIAPLSTRKNGHDEEER